MSGTRVRRGVRFQPGRWAGPAVCLTLGVGFALVCLLAGARTPAVAALVAGVAVAWWNSPARRGMHVPLAETSVPRADDAVVVLWHPGCPFSASLRRRLRREGTVVHWVNIWRDPEGAALCRELNHGVEQVPTALVFQGGRPVVVPASREGILDVLGARPAAA